MIKHTIGFVLLFVLSGCARHAVPPEIKPSTPSQQRAHAAQLFKEGSALAQAGDLTRAEQYLATALREGHEPDRTMRVLLSVCVRASRLRSALVYAAPYLMAHPHDVQLRQLVASIQLALGEVRSAERELRRVVSIDPEAAEARFLLATILEQYPGRELESAEHFAKYVALRPQGVHAEEANASLELARAQTDALNP